MRIKYKSLLFVVDILACAPIIVMCIWTNPDPNHMVLPGTITPIIWLYFGNAFLLFIGLLWLCIRYASKFNVLANKINQAAGSKYFLTGIMACVMLMVLIVTHLAKR